MWCLNTFSHRKRQRAGMFCETSRKWGAINGDKENPRLRKLVGKWDPNFKHTKRHRQHTQNHAGFLGGSVPFRFE